MERQRTFRQQTMSNTVISCAQQRINVSPSHSVASCVERGLDMLGPTRELLFGEGVSRKRCVRSSTVRARLVALLKANIFLSQNGQNQHTIGHMTNAVRWHNTTHVVLACCGPNRTPNKNVSCKTRLGQLQTCIDTSVTLNSTTNSNRTTTRHMRAPIFTCHNARVSPLGNFPCVTHDNTEHASRTEKEPLQMHLRNRSGVMHTRWLFKHTQMLEHTSMSTR